jgi:hypothetical protein
MCVNIKDLETTDEYITIHSDDIAGNASKAYKLKNPYFVGEIESGQEDKSLDNPDSIEATDPTKARGTVTDDYITQGRELFTVDASGKTFYLIVDRTQNQENVYLLTEAGVNDLLNFTDYNGVDVQNGDVPMYEIPSAGGRRAEEPEQPVEEEPEKEKETETAEAPKSNSATMFIIVVIICGVGVGYYFLKNKKRKEDLAEAEEMDAFDTPDDNDIPEGETIYEGEDEDEEAEETEADTDVADADNLIELTESDIVYKTEDGLDPAEQARLLAYFGNKGTEQTDGDPQE